jgi:hypothetical protein
VVTENKMTKNGMGKPSMFWTSSTSGMSHLNWSGTDIGRDPMEGFMESLGHNPKASADFFNSSIDLTPGDTTDDKKVDAFDYFTKDRDWPKDVADGGETNKYGYDSLGHALESATLGHAYDDQNAALVRSDDGAKVMEKVVAQYGGDAELLKKQESLSDSIGHMGAGYIDDIDWALAEHPDLGDNTSNFAPPEGSEGHIKLGRADAQNFLSSIGQHPDAYADVGRAQAVYTSSVLEAHTGPQGVDPDEATGPALEAMRVGAQVQGTLDHSRVAQIAAEGAKAADDYGKALDARSGWVDFGVGAAIGAGAAFLPISAPAAGAAAVLVPLAMDNGQGAVEQFAGQITNGWFDGSSDSWSDDHDKSLHDAEKAVYTAGESNSEAPMDVYMKGHGVDVGSRAGQQLVQATQLGYEYGSGQDQRQGNLPETG